MSMKCLDFPILIFSTVSKTFSRARVSNRLCACDNIKTTVAPFCPLESVL